MVHGRAVYRARPWYRVRIRTTIEFDDDVEKVVAELRRERGVGVSEAVNELIRRAMLPRPRVAAFSQRTRRLGLSIDVSDVAGALEGLEGDEAR